MLPPDHRIPGKQKHPDIVFGSDPHRSFRPDNHCRLRHTAATLMYQYGNVDIRVLKDILGHANLGTTQIYTHVSDKQVKQAIDSNPLSGVKDKK
ncbi:MAG TPA: hypothetical protein DEO89_03620 [Lachnospiraceae bacterium]|nr:hypothetical protein [Lachnospiraceae bacterium]